MEDDLSCPLFETEKATTAAPKEIHKIANSRSMMMVDFMVVGVFIDNILFDSTGDGIFATRTRNTVQRFYFCAVSSRKNMTHGVREIDRYVRL